MDPRIQIRIRIHTKLSWNRNNAFFKAVTSTVTNLCFWRAKEEIEALVAENKALKEELAEMRTQEKRRKLFSPATASDKPKLNIKGIIFCFGTYHRVGRVLTAKLFFPVVGIGTPPPPTRRRVCPPHPLVGGRGGTLAYERGVGGIPIPTREHTQWYSVYISTLWYLP
jgi:hypothetical protein